MEGVFYHIGEVAKSHKQVMTATKTSDTRKI